MVSLFPRVRVFDKKIEGRVKKIKALDLLSWAENSSYAVERCMTEYNKSGEPQHLSMAIEAAEATYCLLNEIRSRKLGP